VHRIIGKSVAIKVLHERYCDRPDIVARFTEEGSAVNRIAHPNIVDIFGFGTLDTGQQYLVMELLDGESLAQRLQRQGPLRPEEALELLRGVASALDATHAQNILHLDLKPENIFLVRRHHAPPTPKLLDFGISKVIGTTARETGEHAPFAVIGTREYMAPEQCEGQALDPRVDVYALGIVAYEMLTGARPCEPERTTNGDDNSTNVRLSPSRRNVPLPVALEQTLRRWFATDPEQRPTRASDAVERLAAVLGEITAVESPLRARDTKPRIVIASVIGGVLLLGLSWFYVHTRVPTDTAPKALEGIRSNSASSIVPSPVILPKPAPEITVKLEVTPAQFELYLDGQSRVAPQGLLRLERGDQPRKISFRAKGFEDESVTIIPDRDQVRTIELRRRAPADGKPKKQRVLPRSSKDLEF
jgi:serine/threonine protein kinase